MSTESGKVIQVIGPVVDVEFPPGKLPNIFNAIKIEQAGDGTDGQSSINLTMEVAQHLGENRARGGGHVFLPMDWCEAWKSKIPGLPFRFLSEKKHWDGWSMS